MKILKGNKHHITSLKQFFSIMNERHSATRERPIKWMYRGQDNYEFKLLPCLGRLLGTGKFTDLETLYFFEKNSFAQFELLTYSQMKETNPFILLAVAQHHGMKTRLLDWTFSPLVALFFAVENESNYDVDGAIFALNTQRHITNIIRSNKSPFEDLGSDYQYLAIPSISPRIIAQNAVFQLFREPATPLEQNEGLEKFIIPAKSKRELKIELYNAGISYNSLFPDLDGITKNINYMYLSKYN